MARQHRIYRVTRSNGQYEYKLIETVPFIEGDPNQGLPYYVFEAEDLVLFEVEDDTIEWIPACGPAPCWKAKLSDFKTDRELWTAFDEWFLKTY
jgi:hypothetical protein